MGEITGLITARGGSKAIPRKNVKPLAGKPLIAWTIEAALQSRELSRIIVSTDDGEIAQVALEWGAEMLFMRPAELAQDDSSHISVVVHAIQWLREHEKAQPEYLVLLQPTSPLRTAADIDGVIQLAVQRNAEAVVTVVETHVHPYLTRRMTDRGTLVEFVPCDIPYPRRQALPPAYFINGAVFMNRCDSLLAKQTFYPEDTYGYIMPPERSLQIDTPWDWYVAGLILRDSLTSGSTQTTVRSYWDHIPCGCKERVNE